MYLIFPCPPLPYLIVGGMSTFRIGDRHLRRTLPHTFDLIYVHQGELFMEENGQNFTVTTGQFLILPPNRLHRGTKACRTETVFHWLHFYTTGTFSCTESPVRDSNVIQKSSQQFEKKPFHISLPQYGTILEELQPNMLDIMEQITQARIDRKENSKRFSDNTIPQLKLQQLFFTLLTYIGESSLDKQPHDPAAEIFAFLNDHYREDLRLDEIAEHFSFHPAYVIRLLKKRYQKTPGQIIQQLRLEKAAQMLTASNASIQTIAYENGFNDSGYFARLFKRHYGVTPHQWRNKTYSQ